MRAMSVVVIVVLSKRPGPSVAHGLVISCDLDHMIAWQTLQVASHTLSALAIASLVQPPVCPRWSLTLPLPSVSIKRTSQNAERPTPKRRLRNTSVFNRNAKIGSEWLSAVIEEAPSGNYQTKHFYPCFLLFSVSAFFSQPFFKTLVILTILHCFIGLSFTRLSSVIY